MSWEGTKDSQGDALGPQQQDSNTLSLCLPHRAIVGTRGLEFGAVEDCRGTGLSRGHQETAWEESRCGRGRGQACGLAWARTVAEGPQWVSPCALFWLWSRRGQAGSSGTLALWFLVQPSPWSHRPMPFSKSVDR